jgi:hypothetical protein
MEDIKMRISTRRPKWEQFRESHVLRVGKEQRVLGRVDLISSVGYWWQTADKTDVAYNLQDAKRKVEDLLRLSGGVVVIKGMTANPMARAA